MQLEQVDFQLKGYEMYWQVQRKRGIGYCCFHQNHTQVDYIRPGTARTRGEGYNRVKNPGI